MANGAATLEMPGAEALGSLQTGFSVTRMMAVARKELRSYFAFPLVYVLGGIFLLLAGFYAYTDLNFFITISFSHDIIQNYWQLLFTDMATRCTLLTMPFVTMRLFAEERKLGTVELLYTYPLRDGEILGGKFLASVAIFAIILAMTVLYPVYVYTIHAFPIFPLLAGYLGVFLLGCAFIACGVFISSLCESTVIAGVATIMLLLFLYVLNWNEAAVELTAMNAVRMVSLFDQFGDFAKGVIDLYHVTYFIFFIGFFLYLTLRSMEARKWTGRR